MEKRPRLYERLPNGRYREWHEPEPPKTDNALYRRVGRKYIPVQVHIECNSWQEGVFVVTKANHSWSSAEYLQQIFKLYRCGDIENVSIARLGGMKKLADHLAQHWNEIEGKSTYELASSVVAILMNYEKEAER